MRRAEAAELVPRRTREVYTAGLGGYRFFRIPVLLRAGEALLAFAEGRPTLRDHGSIEIVRGEPVSWHGSIFTAQVAFPITN